MATHCLGPFLLTRCLQDIIIRTAQDPDVEVGDTRLVWVTSFVDNGAKGGMVIDPSSGEPQILADSMENYLASKTGSVFLAHEWSERLRGEGIISVVRLSASQSELLKDVSN